MDCAIFDFDRTLTRQDSFQVLLVSRLRAEPWRVFLLFTALPLLLLTHVFKFEKRWAKSWVLWSCTVGYGPKESFALLQKLPLVLSAEEFWLPRALERLKKLQQGGMRIVLCTASAGEWVEPLLASKGVHSDVFVGTRIAYRFGGLVLASRNCYGEEKVKRLLPHLAGLRIKETYSDHPSDIPLLNLGEKAFLVEPKPEHMQEFTERLKVPFEVRTWSQSSSGARQ